MLSVLSISAALAGLLSVNAAPATDAFLKRNNDGKTDYKQYYNVEGHRGARGEGIALSLRQDG